MTRTRRTKQRTARGAARGARPRERRGTGSGPHGPGRTSARPEGSPVRFRRWIAAAVVLLALGTGAFVLRHGGLTGARHRASPIILISIDTLRADHLPVYGYTRIQTPAIEALARDGTVFESCFTHVPLTLPAHTSIFTGLLPTGHGVLDNIGFKVPGSVTTVASELRQAGYHTGGAVSAYVLRSDTGISRGFDWYDDALAAPDARTVLTDVRRDGAETLERALGWLERRSKDPGPGHRGAPPFLFLHLYEPHAPYKPPERFLRAGTSPYDGAIMYADEIVGRLFAALRRMGLYDRSLIILLSDHGEGLGDHGEATHGVFLYREVLHVPLIVKLPGSAHGGRRIPVPVQLVDIAPTLLQWAGLSPGPAMAGHSLLPALRGRTFKGDRSIFSESLYGRLHFGWSPLYSMTTGRYQLILAPHEELYDIRRDPGETHNLLGGDVPLAVAKRRLSRPQAMAYVEMHRELERVMQHRGAAAAREVDQEQVAKLRSLGYLGSSSAGLTLKVEGPDPKDRIGDLSKYQRATRMEQARLFVRAAATLEEVVAGSPHMADAWHELAGVYRRLGRFGDAARALEQSLRIDPSQTAQRFELADTLIQLRRFEEAQETLKVAAAQAPYEAAVWQAYLAMVEGGQDAAREAAARAAGGIPAAVPYVEGLEAYWKQQFAEAARLLRQALNGGHAAGTLPYVHFYLGDALAQRSRSVADPGERARLLQEAEQQLRMELDLRPTNTAAIRSLCVVHAFQRQWQKIDQDLGWFARENPSPAAYGFIASIYRQMNATGRAARWEQRARQAQAAAARPR